MRTVMVGIVVIGHEISALRSDSIGSMNFQLYQSRDDVSTTLGVIVRGSGRSSIRRLLDSSTAVSGILGRPVKPDDHSGEDVKRRSRSARRRDLGRLPSADRMDPTPPASANVIGTSRPKGGM